jgi:hypothetical protein
MIYRIFPLKDTFISNQRVRNAAQTGSNFGSSEILHLSKLVYTSGSGITKILTKFDLSPIAALTASAQAPSSGIKYNLVLKHAQHSDTLPSSYDVVVAPVSQDWDEGRGHDVDYLSDKGFANWDKAKSNSFWSVPGASGSGPVASFHFDSGYEDLSVDVTNIVNGWLTGGASNNGFLVSFSGSFQTDASDYHVKMFHSRETNFLDKRPYLEASWKDYQRDDRSNFVFNTTGSLFLYYTVQGQPTNVPAGNLSVSIADASGTLFSISGSPTGVTGIYSASFAIATGSYSGSTFFDSWSVSGRELTRGSFTVSAPGASVVLGQDLYVVNIKNLKNQYDVDESPTLHMHVRPKDYNPAVVLTASLGSTGVIWTKAYYRVSNDRTDEIVIHFGTGSDENTRLSYDGNGNYFNLPMRNFAPGNVYRICFLVDSDGQRQVLDRDFKFKVF